MLNIVILVPCCPVAPLGPVTPVGPTGPLGPGPGITPPAHATPFQVYTVPLGAENCCPILVGVGKVIAVILESSFDPVFIVF